MNRFAIQRIGFAVLALAALVVVSPIVLVIATIVVRGISAINWEFLTAIPREGMKAGGIFPAIVGTVILTLGTALVAIPVGVGGAVYLAEYARDTAFTRAIRLLFLQLGTSIVAGSLTLAIMTLPVVISTAEEALRAVPTEFRTVSASVGGTQWQGIWHVVLPQAMPGIITGIILGLLRAAGETAPILFTVAAFYLPRIPRSAFDQTMALPYHLYVISTQVPGMPEQIQYGTALVLLAVTLSMNGVATAIRSVFRRRREW